MLHATALPSFRCSSRRVLASLAAVLLGASTAAAGVLVVDASGREGVTEISTAVAAAAQGDTILVKGGVYGPVIINAKSLTVVAEEGAEVVIDGSLRVQNLPSNRRVVISGLEATSVASAGIAGLVLFGNQGSVRLQDCRFTGAANFTCDPWPQPGDGRHGVVVSECADVSLTDCVLLGGAGHGSNFGGDCYFGGTGGFGLQSSESHVALYDCVLVGAQGGYGLSESLGGNGGAGARVQGGRLFASGSSFTGGKGGLGCDFFPITGYGNGGHGLHILAGAQGELLDNTYVAGPAGTSSLGIPGAPGEALRNDGSTGTYTGSSHGFDATPAAVRELQPLTLSFTGAPGDLAFVLVALGPDELLLPNAGGVVLLDLPLLLGPLPLAPIPLSGTLSLSLNVPAVSPATNGLPIFMQGAVSESAGVRLTGSATVVLLDDAF